MMNFSAQDLNQIEDKGISITDLEDQIQKFKKGTPFVELTSAATVNNGILRLDGENKRKLIHYYNDHKDSLSITKFVPASGAATRMFKFLFEYLEEPAKTNALIDRFFEHIKCFPFYNILMKNLPLYYEDYKHLEQEHQQLAIVTTLLDLDKLNLASYPKGLLPFHTYNNLVVTAFEEHLNEASDYASVNGHATLHFTVGKEHQVKFEEILIGKKNAIEKQLSMQFEVSFSNQMPSTDTIAVNPDNTPFRKEDGSLLFRPSGHGALIKNLNDIDADIIFIKNIDNVSIRSKSKETSENKKLLAGKLLELQGKAFNYLEKIESNANIVEDLHDIISFVEHELNSPLNSNFESLSDYDKIMVLKEKLNRPIRVCGMVKNEGEPGGGPFWIRDENNRISLQIIESAQVNKSDDVQEAIFSKATHFNPVDLVCGVKDYKGNKFDLNEFVDTKAVFISSKTHSGQHLKALELPGLWNGGMAFWNTVFIEVPLSTFNPVKTVNDLLKPQHQNS